MVGLTSGQMKVLVRNNAQMIEAAGEEVNEVGTKDGSKEGGKY